MWDVFSSSLQPFFKGWFFCLFVSWRMDAIKKKMQAMKVEKGGGLFPLYTLHIFHRPFHSDKFMGQIQSLLPISKGWIERGPRSFPVVLSSYNSLPQALTASLLLLFPSLCVAGIACPHFHVCKLKGEEVEPNKTTARKKQASSNVYFSLHSPALRHILFSLQVQLNLWEINRAKRIRFACKKVSVEANYIHTFCCASLSEYFLQV